MERGETGSWSVWHRAGSARRSRSRWRPRSRLITTPAPFTAPGSAMILAPDLLRHGLAEASSTVSVTLAVHGALILAAFASPLAPPQAESSQSPGPTCRDCSPQGAPPLPEAPSAAILLSLRSTAAPLISACVPPIQACQPRDLPRIVDVPAHPSHRPASSQLPGPPPDPCLSCEDPRPACSAFRRTYCQIVS